MTDPIIQQILTHISVLNDEVSSIEITLAILTERIDWLVKFFWVVATALVGIGVSQAWQIRRMIKNGKNNK